MGRKIRDANREICRLVNEEGHTQELIVDDLKRVVGSDNVDLSINLPEIGIWQLDDTPDTKTSTALRSTLKGSRPKMGLFLGIDMRLREEAALLGDEEMREQLLKFLELLTNMTEQATSLYQKKASSSVDNISDFTIEVKRLEVGSYVLVFPTVRNQIWSIFNVNHKNAYMKECGLSNSMGTCKWCIGKINSIECRISKGKVRA